MKNRYAVRFYKDGNIRYISHLDLLRLFKRTFKRAGIRLQYSQGFNPHPKMSFAQPLSLGYSSSSEYLEFETQNTYSTDVIAEKLNSLMPEGLGILSCEELPDKEKSLAAMTEAADYEITIPVDDSLEIENTDLLREYISQDQIKVMKRQKKSGRKIEINIKPLIYSISVDRRGNCIMLEAKLAAGSVSNLSPELVLTTFCEFTDISYDRATVAIKRKEIYFIK
ncbi:MAG: TIGR03936 family radical SAM-associated protein [Eubacteriales bacterium]|nr:TIGR03936 family radical SAM-associated protein [Eubacteriales bacterium]